MTPTEPISLLPDPDSDKASPGAGSTFLKRAGGALGNAGSMISNWFRDDETGLFSAPKALMTAVAMGIMAWTATNMPWLFAAMAVFMVVAGATVFATGTSFANPHQGKAPLSPVSQEPAREKEPERVRVEDLEIPGMPDLAPEKTTGPHGPPPSSPPMQRVDPSILDIPR